MFPNSSKPKIRTRTVAVPVKKPPPVKPQGDADAYRKRSAPAVQVPKSRYSLTPSIKVAAAKPSAERKSLSVSRVQQRKRKVTPTKVDFGASSDESSDGEDDDRLGVRKRQKTSSSSEPMPANRSLEPDLKRRIRIQESQDERGGAAESKDVRRSKLIHGLEMITGEYVKKFKPAFPDTKDLVVKLQYPSLSRPEKFGTSVPRDPSDFNPIEDICYSIEEIVQHYLPPELSAELSNQYNGTVPLLKRAVNNKKPADFESALTSFNAEIRSRVEDGTIPEVLDNRHSIPLSLTKRILAQVYQRVVSPRAHLLRHSVDKATTYGELLPSFIHTIFQQTKLNSESVFVDLGSGVANVVLQSALQTGAESWGIEILDTPAAFADQQADELRARCKLWNISLGTMHLLHGNMIESPEIDKVLPRADVVLVNNKVFPPFLNGALLDKFLDLKVGAKVVSLQSFGLGGKKGVRNEQSVATLFDEDKFFSGTDSVNWEGDGVDYFIATKAR